MRSPAMVGGQGSIRDRTGWAGLRIAIEKLELAHDVILLSPRPAISTIDCSPSRELDLSTAL